MQFLVYQHTGDVVAKGESIVRIADLKHLDIYADLPIRFLHRVRQLNRLHVIFLDYLDQPFLLPVKAIGGEVNKERQTIPVRLNLDNTALRFRPGMMVRIYFAGETHAETLTIPRSALLEEEGVYYCFVVQGNRVSKREITTGIKQDQMVEVLTGLQEGESVATKKSYSLTDGMEVTVQ
ncbi:MAG: efflux RND transporter periplasmic adaptor subunit [Bacteroidales bacterium]|nr:efflux RND transporter periplasmic adaptor subunit [Bacteroidales bacterium]